jgi:predicted RNA binding protein with dsRBD fold (UPF0201 family)
VDEIDVHVEVKVNPTEDLEKVKKAVENIFGNIEFEVTREKRGSLLVAEAMGIGGLTTLRDLLRRERIRDAARGVFFEGLSNKSVVFFLNKQVAYVPVGESPLGPIKVQIRCDSPQELIKWLTPKTTKRKQK